MRVGVHQCPGWIADGKRFAPRLTIYVVLSTPVDLKVRRLVDEGSSLAYILS